MTPPEFQTNEPLDPVAWVPLLNLAANGFGRGFDSRETIEQRIETLQRELAEDVLLDDIGMPHVRRSLARQLFAERTTSRAEQQRRHEEWQRRHAELDARNKAQLRGGIPATPGSTALLDMLGADRR